MIYFGILLGIVLLVAMVFMALRKESSLSVRIACLISLALMILSVIVCLFIVFMGGRASADDSIVIVAPSTSRQAPKANSNFYIVVLLAIFLAGLFILIIIMSMREHNKNKVQGNKSKKSGFF